MLFGYFYLQPSISGEVKTQLTKSFLFTIFVTFFITLFCALGTWQLYRMQWKTNLINEISIGLKSTPIRYSKTIKKNYQRVLLNGKYNFKNQIYLYSLNEKGQPGFDVITPFTTLYKDDVLVNRGWIEKKFKNKKEIDIINKNSIQGLLRANVKANIFKPENDIKNNIWFSIDVKAINKINNKKFSNFIIFLENTKKKYLNLKK